ncbi:MAG TPA: DHHA1 domain-containing protein [Chroococcales cyanobacterium]|jgi:oligoribonuclease NrnB/cAMP/cGMP phosphodiesterase (DHH superfamily)
MKTKVLYHRGCNDGFTAAYCAWTVLGDTAKYIGVSYGEEPPSIEPGDRIFVVDFSYARKVMLSWEKVASELVVLDHHKTAQEALQGLPFATFDMNKSGAVLAWEYWHPNEPLPTLIRYVQDRDLWKKELILSDEVSVLLRSFKKDFEVWDVLAQQSSADLLSLAWMIGTPILKKRQRDVEAIASAYTWKEIGGYKVPIVYTSKPGLASDIGHYLCKLCTDAPFSAVGWSDGQGKTRWGLRSSGDFDVSQIAKQFGGGGHKNAAGFEQKTE